MAPANTGRDRSNKNAVTKIDHTNNGMLWSLIPGLLILSIVTIKLIAPIRLLIPAKWSENIAYSTAGPGLYKLVDKGGYIVQPVPTPGPPIVNVDRSRLKLKGSNQKNSCYSFLEKPYLGH